MKKRRSPAIPLFVAGFLLLSSGACSAAARLLSSEGRVEINLTGDAAAWTPLVSGQSIPDKAQVRTAGGATCEIALLGGHKSVISLKEKTHITVESSAPADIRLHAGRFFTLVRELKSGEFLVRTPASVAAARGTGGDHGLDSLAVHDGSFHVTTESGETRDIAEGDGVFFEGDGFGETFEVDAASKEEWGRFEQQAEASLSSVSEPSQDDGGQTGSSAEEGPSEEEGPDAFEDAEGESSPAESGLEAYESFSESRDENTQDVRTDEDIEDLKDDDEDDKDDGSNGGSTTGSIVGP